MKRTSVSFLFVALLAAILGLVFIAPLASAQGGDEPVTLTLLHNSDGESALLSTSYVVPAGSPYGNTEPITLTIGGVAPFGTLLQSQVSEASEAGNAVLAVYAGDAFLASTTVICSLPPYNEPVYDAIAQRQLPYTAHVFGNHEFDFGPGFLEQFIRSFDTGAGLDQPFLSANLDFSAQSGYSDLIDPDGLIRQQPEDDQPIARSMIYTDTATGAVFGLVGATTPELRTISSPGDIDIIDTLEGTAAAVQSEIGRLQDNGVDKIIFVSHLQSLENDIELIGMLDGIDLAVGGGGDEVLVNPTISQTVQLLPGETSSVYGDYPLEVTDAGGRTVYLVTTKGNYRYLGRLDVNFDADGEVTDVVTEQSYPRRVIPDEAGNQSAIDALGLTDVYTPDAALVSSVVTPVTDCIQGFSEDVVARSEVVLDVSREAVRGEESNMGNLIADAYAYVYDNYAESSGVTALDNPVVVGTNGGGIRQNAGDELTGDITRQNTLDVLPFANDLVVIENVEPALLKSIFERSVADPLPAGAFLQVSGIVVQYDLSQPVGSRVVSLALADGTSIVENGEVAENAPVVNFVTNSFTAAGGDDYQMLIPLDKIPLKDENGNISYERALVKYLTEDTESFPIINGEPTIQASDPRYAPGGEGRIIFAGGNNDGTSQVTVVHAVAGLNVDVYVDGQLLLRGFRPGQVSDPLTLDAGDYRVVIVERGGDPNDNPAIDETVTVPANQNISLVAHLDADGNPTLSTFINDVSTSLSRNKTRIIIRHVAAAPEVDALIHHTDGGRFVWETILNISNGEQASLEVPYNQRQYLLELRAAGTEDRVFGPRPLLARGNKVVVFYVYGSLEGQGQGGLRLLRQSIELQSQNEPQLQPQP